MADNENLLSDKDDNPDEKTAEGDGKKEGLKETAKSKEELEALKKEANDALILDTLMYTIEGYAITRLPVSVYDIVMELEIPAGKEDSYLAQEISILKDIMADEQNKQYWSTVNMSNPSWQTGWYNGGTIAAAFKDSGGNVTVAYRGTHDGEWLDNTYAFAGSDSPQQREALSYFDYTVESFGAGYFEDNRLTVTGHSKGGNKAQYVTLVSDYGDLIDGCYSFDGQGFSWEAIGIMKQKSNYRTQLEKMYSISGDNDFVNVLGCDKVFLDGHIFYLKTNNPIGLGDYHEIAFLFKDGEMCQINWDGQENLALYAAEVSGSVAKLPSEHSLEITRTVMQLFEIGSGDQNIGFDGDTASLSDFAGLVTHGLPAIFLTSVGTQEGRVFLLEQLDKVILDTYKKNGIQGVAGLMFVTMIAAPVVLPALISLTLDLGILSGIIDRFHHFNDKVAAFNKHIVYPAVNLLINAASMTANTMVNASKKAAGMAAGNIITAANAAVGAVRITASTAAKYGRIAANIAADNVSIAASIAANNARIATSIAANNARIAANLVAGNFRITAGILTGKTRFAAGVTSESAEIAAGKADEATSVAIGAMASIGELAVANAASVIDFSVKKFDKKRTETARLFVDGCKKILLSVNEINEVSRKINNLQEIRAALAENVKDAKTLVERVKAEYSEDYVKRSCQSAMEEINTALKRIGNTGVRFDNIVSILKTATSVFVQTDDQQASRIRQSAPG